MSASGSNPIGDPSHPFWDVMKNVTGSGEQSGAGPNTAIDTGMSEPGGDGDVDAYADGGYVKSRDVVNGVPSYRVGNPGLSGAVKDFIDHVTHGGVEGAQQTAAKNTAIRVDSNETGKPDGYADGGYVDIPHGDDVTRPSIGSAVAMGSALGHNVEQGNLARAGRAAQEAGLDPDTTPDPDAGKPSGIQTAAHTLMHPIQAVRKAVTDLADYLGHPDNNHDGDKALDAPAAAAAAPAAPDASAAIPTDGAPAAAPAAGAAPAATPEAAVVKDAAAKENIPTNMAEASAQAKASPAAPVGKVHSLGPDFYEGVHQRAVHAAHLAAKAGLDPKQIYDNSMSMAISHMQGQVMRSYGAAYNALQANDMDGVKKALNDANYYLPNGKELDFKKNPQTGALQVRNPFIGMPGHEKDPDLIDINPQSISLMATAALHPENFHSEIAGMVKAETEARKDAADSASKAVTANAAMTKAQGYDTWAKAKANSQKFLDWLHGAQAQYEARRSSGATGQPKIGMSQYTKAQDDGRKAVERLANGYPTPGAASVPAIGPDGQPAKDNNGNPIFMPNPAAGRMTPDPTKVPADFKGLNPDAKMQIGNAAGHIHAANAMGTPNGGPGVTDTESALIAAKLYQWTSGNTHNVQDGQWIKQAPHTLKHMEGPEGKKHAVPDIVEGVGKDKGITHVWMGNGWRDIYTTENVAQAGIDTGAGASEKDEGDEPVDPDAGNPADNEPAE